MNKQINILQLPNYVLLNIIKYLTDSDDYNNLRICNKFFYNFLNIIKIFYNNICIKTIERQNNRYFYNDYYYNQKKKTEINYILNTKRNKIFKTNMEKEYFNNNKNSLKRITEYKNGHKHGIEKFFFQNNIIFKQRYYKYGIKLKNEYVNYTNGSLKFLINHNGVKKLIKKFSKSEMCYEINLKNNSLHGKCNYYIFKNLKKSANYKNGYLHGILKNYKLFGIDEIINYENNKKNGIFMCLNFIKKIEIIGNFKEDKLNGLLIFFSHNKITKTIKLVNGTINGNYILYTNNKTIYPFKNNLLHGYCKEYNFNNKIKYKIKYINNKFANIYKKYDYFGYLNTEIVIINSNEYIMKKYDKNILLYSLYKINNKYYFLINGKKICLN